ncbi:hypothetical protein [Hahella ganghwensis]|uniref:phage adaptor protein n=1 Tax=Hahella ganghwensis TaxID=286420 RepID=UPI000371C155|nr:hypothetical protein [Hahella ganghwensis]
MANFLTLCADLAREAGLMGGAGPSSVTGQTGEAARLVNWIKQANIDIQRQFFDWKFLWVNHTVSLVAGSDDYPAPIEYHYWQRDKFSINGSPVEVIEWENWDQLSTAGEGQPYQVVIMPDGGLKVFPTPDKAYTLIAPYYRRPQVLALNTDIPLIPESFHDLIWMRALIKYAHYESAPEVLERVQIEYPEGYEQLKASQLPDKYRYGASRDADPLTVVVV